MKILRHRGFSDFIRGTFGNAGQNIYVSKAGVLQRIHYFDINKDGYLDLIFENSQDHAERLPVYVYRSILDKPEKIELPTNGSYAAALADINKDGYQDLVIAMQHNGVHGDLNAYIYFGSAEGLSERYRIELPAPNCRTVAIGDFNGDGLPEIAFGSNEKLRIFYQTPEGFIFSRYQDLEIDVTSMYSEDLDSDGFADLYVKTPDSVSVLWGGSDGISPERITILESMERKNGESSQDTTTAGRIEVLDDWKTIIIKIKNKPHLFFPTETQVRLVPVNPDRSFGKPLILNTEKAVSAAIGDINGDGLPDLVVASRRKSGEEEVSWIYWGTPDGFDQNNPTSIRTKNARDVVVADLNGNGFDDIVICQGRNETLYTTESLVYQGSAKGILPEPKLFETHDATSVLVGRTSADNNPQVIFVNHASGRVNADIPIYIYYGGPDGFSPKRRDELLGWAAPDALCCDFNDDGYVDVFIANCSENARHLDPGSFLYWGGKDGFSPDRKLVFPTTRNIGVTCADINRDGYLDLITVGFDFSEIIIFYGGPDGFDLKNPQRIKMEKDGKVYTEPRWLLLADLNNNGWLDLVVSQIISDHSFILWGGPDGFSMERSTFIAVECAGCAHAADLTGNGYLDLLFGSYAANSAKKLEFKNTESFVTIYWNSPNGFREDRKMMLPAHAATSLAIADFNNDGILDIFVGSYHGGRTRDLDSYIYWGGPRGCYSIERRTRLFTHSASGCIAADFNEDGWVDLAVANHKTFGNHPGNSVVWWNGPDGFSEKNVTLLPTNGPHGMLVVEPGNIMDRSAEEYYTSSAERLPADAKVRKIEWVADLPPKTYVRAQVRFAKQSEELEKAVWQGPKGKEGWFENNQTAERLKQSGCWMQYRLALGARNKGSSPRVTEVSIYYSS